MTKLSYQLWTLLPAHGRGRVEGDAQSHVEQQYHLPQSNTIQHLCISLVHDNTELVANEPA